MKYLFSRYRIRCLFAVSLGSIVLPSIKAESHCPGSVASVTPRFVQHALIVIPVRINQAGPFDFMVDTGSQVTIIDPSLASQLDLKQEGRVGLVSVASLAQASVTVLDRLEAGSKVVDKPFAIVHDLGQIRAADPRIRGVLGQSFLAHFDLLQLDSGSDGPILYPGSERPDVQALVHAAVLQGGKVTNAQSVFAVVPPQIMQIGNRIRSHVSFVTPVTVGKSLEEQHLDGLLPTVLFERVFISGGPGDHYVVFDPK
jgi:hypothetical protein